MDIRRKTCVVITYICLAGHQLYSQINMAQFIQENVHQVDNLDFSDTNYQDLEVIGNAIGDRRIVMLGESSHRNGSDFKAKARIIRYLYEKKNFTVLAFESDFFGLNNQYENSNKAAFPIDSIIKSAIYPMWVNCDACRPLFKFIVDKSVTSEPLRITGFDNQLASEYTNRYLKMALKAYMDSIDIPFVHTRSYPAFLSLCDSIIFLKGKNNRQFDEIVAYADIILKDLSKTDKPNNFYQRVVKCIKVFAIQQRYYMNHERKFFYNSNRVRDEIMADNLRWLLENRFKDKKIIIWAHNGHIVKNVDEKTNRQFKLPYSMGFLFTRDSIYRHETYVLGLTSYYGVADDSDISVLGKLVKGRDFRKNGLEYWLHIEDFKFSFVNLMAFNRLEASNKEKYISKLLPNHYPTYWHKMFDGVFYIENAKPCQFEPTSVSK